MPSPPNWRKCEVIFDVANRTQMVESLEHETSAPEFWNDSSKAKVTLDKIAQQKVVLTPFRAIEKALEESGVLLELLEDEPDPKAHQATMDELVRDLDRADEMRLRLDLQMLLAGRMDRNGAYLTLHAGAGGTESCDWAGMLLRMYRRYGDAHGFETEVMDVQPGEEAGIKSATLAMHGPYAYGYLKAERGVHRLVRISPFDSAKRRHTSFASLDVVAELEDDIKVEIDLEDLRVDTFRASGSGGQHVNKTDSAIRLTHLPTGIVVSCQAERSQYANRTKAMKLLEARLYEYEADKKRKDLERFYGQKGEIAWGNQIRSYVLQPYTMAKDHRTAVETSNVEGVLDGDLDRFIVGYLKQLQKETAIQTSPAGGA